MRARHLLLTLPTLALALAGCVATDDAADVTPTSATLRGSVSTQDQPSRVHFEYATSAAALGSAAAARTPDQPIAAKTSGAALRATVTGLTPDSTYSYALCEAIGTATTFTCDTKPRAFVTPVADEPGSLSSTPGPGFVTDGAVTSVARSADATYLAGTFSRIGPRTGPAAALSTATAAVDPAMPQVTGGDAEVDVVAPDGAGGWYLGGSFTRVGGVARRNVAHIRADKSVDPAFRPDPDGRVLTVAPAGTSVYIGGEFTTVGGQPRRNLAQVDATGTPTAFAPDPDGDRSYGLTPGVTALTVTASTVYVGGQFETIAGQPRVDAAAFTRSGGMLTAWDAHIVPNGAAAVHGIFPRGDRIILAGAFARVADQPRGGLAWVSASSGALVPGIGDPLPETGFSGAAIAPDGATLFLVGGAGTARGVIRVRTADGTVLPSLETRRDVEAVAVSGDTVYAGGGAYPTSTLDPITGFQLDAFDLATGAPKPFDAQLSGIVRTLAVAGGTLYVGGNLRSANMTPRTGILKVDRAGKLTSFAPDVQNVSTLALAGSTLYAAGGFTTAGGQARGGLAAFDAGSGGVLPWNPGPVAGGVSQLAPAGSLVYIAGDFRRIGNQDRNSLAAVNATTGAVTGWNPNITSRLLYTNEIVPGSIFTMAVAGDRVYIGGRFSGTGFTFGPITAAPRTNLAAIDTASGNATDWKPEPGNSGLIYALAVSGSTVYVGGGFGTLGGQPRRNLAAVTTAGTVTSFQADPDNQVNALAVAGSRVYVGGYFKTIAGSPRRGLASLDADSARPTTWAPDLSLWQPGTGYQAGVPLAIVPLGDTVVVGGSFDGTERAAQGPWATFGPAG